MKTFIAAATTCGLLAALAVGMTANAATTPTLSVKQVFRSTTVPQGQIVNIDATCPSGYVLSGGGLGVGANDIVYADSTNSRNWQVAVGNYSTVPDATATATAFCVKGTRNLAVRTSLTANQRAALIRQSHERH